MNPFARLFRLAKGQDVLANQALRPINGAGCQTGAKAAE